MKRLVAIVEDEPAIRDNYAAGFMREGYAVRTYAHRAQAMSAFAARLPDLAVIDISLEDEPEGGFELCRQLRALSAEVPIIFLTARDSEIDAVSGLRLGADDFLTKDLSLAHLIARVNALFRRVDALRKPNTPGELVRRGALTLDAERMQAQWDGQVVLLSLTEFWIVHALARHPGHVRNRQQLMDAANVVLDDNTITSHVKRIRRKFQSIDPKSDAGQTGSGRGYRWVECPSRLMSLRLKLLLLGLATLVLPWGGCQYAREMESALREGEENSLQAVSQTIAASLQGRTDLLYREALPPADAPDPLTRGTSGHAFLRSDPNDLRPLALTAAPLLDGYSDDWPHDPSAWAYFAKDDRHRFAILSGVYERMLYVLLEVRDEHPLFDAPGTNTLDPASFGDRVWLGFEDSQGEQRQVFLAAKIGRA